MFHFVHLFLSESFFLELEKISCNAWNASPFWGKRIIISVEFDETGQKDEMININTSYLFSYKILHSYFEKVETILREICAYSRKFKCLKIYEMKIL